MTPTTPTPITLADGKVRHLRYSLGDVKRIKAKFAPLPAAPESATQEEKVRADPFQQIMGRPAEDLLPVVLMLGIVEKEGLTEQILTEELLTGPMIDSALAAFVEAFFGERQTLIFKIARAQQDAALDALTPKPPAPPVPPDPPTIVQ